MASHESGYDGEDWSSRATPSQLDDSGTDTSQPDLQPVRHRDGGELGRGGMARVTSGFDPVLERPVALKRSLHGTPADDARLLREARLTAQLDHPAIASVLDVGVDRDGALVAVLHVRQGESFAAAVRNNAGAPRAKLLRALLAASQAVAHAHSRGVLHRDLSANNVRVGADGAVWVLDWGLAATVDEAAAGGFRGGTEGAQSPEQRLGEPLTRASDVWSLGALLKLLLTGHNIHHAARPRDVPRPLWAIAERALHYAPSHRYVDAGAFADDLARYLDGQAVQAWPEGAFERFSRVASRRPRVTAAIIGATLLALVGALVATQSVLRAQREARDATSRLLLDSAERALHADDLLGAKALARQALETGGDSLRARGLLAATARASTVLLVDQRVAPCALVDLDGDRSLCTSPERWDAVRFADGAVLEASRDQRLTLTGSPDMRALTGGAARLTINAARTRAALVLSDGVVLASSTALGPLVHACEPGQPTRAAVPWGDDALVVCGDNTLVTASAAGVTRRRPLIGLSSSMRGASVADVLNDTTLVVGTAAGELGLVDIERSELTWMGTTSLGLITTVLPSADGRRVLVLGERGAALFRPAEGVITPIKADLRRGWRDGASGHLAQARDGTLMRFALDETLVMTHGAHGRAAMAVHEGRRLVATGDAMGTVALAHLDTGALREVGGLPRVIKSLDFSPDGRFLVLGAAGPDGLLVFHTDTLARVATPWDGNEEVRGRHVAFITGDTFVVFGWGATPFAARFEGDRFVEQPLAASMGDVRDVSCREGSCVLLSATSQAMWLRFDDGRFTVAPFDVPAETRLIARSPDGRALVTVDTQLRLPDGRALNEPALEDVAIDDGGRVALCRRDGSVALLDAALKPVFDVAAHTERCARVSFCDDGRALCTVGWDGRLRVLSEGR